MFSFFKKNNSKSINKENRQELKAISDFKEIHKGKRCFIIGNGPSLKMEDLDRLKNEYCFGVNRIYLSFDETEWRPSYYVIQDRNMLLNYVEEIEELDLPIKFVPGYMEENFSNKKGNVFFYNYVRRLFDGSEAEFSFDVSNQTFEGGTVTYLCMQLAVYMGFTEIYLLGNDFTYSVEKTDEGIHVNPVQDYFSEKYITSGEKRFFPRIDLCQKGFEKALEESKIHNFKIYNATRGGRLEVFERVDFDSLF